LANEIFGGGHANETPANERLANDTGILVNELLQSELFALSARYLWVAPVFSARAGVSRATFPSSFQAEHLSAFLLTWERSELLQTERRPNDWPMPHVAGYPMLYPMA
jgi:hypothetical protein